MRALPIFLLFLFNWFILYLVLSLLPSFGMQGAVRNEAIAALAFVILFGLAFLLDSPLGQQLLRLLSGARKPIERETDKINPILGEVQRKVQEVTASPPLPVQLMILDDPMPTAFSTGKATLAISRGLYEKASSGELAAVIAHECAHLHNGDSHRLGIAAGISLPSLVVTAASGAIARFASTVIANHNGKDEGTILSILCFILLVFAGFFGLIARVGAWLLSLITLFTGRQQELEADRFAVRLGYGAGLLSFLDKIKDLEAKKSGGVFNRLYATHPDIMLRIGKIEEILKD